MKSSKVMDRFTKYLNRSFFQTQKDPFIRKKYLAYLKKTGDPDHKSFFQRMKEDNVQREQRARIRKDLGRRAQQESP